MTQHDSDAYDCRGEALDGTENLGTLNAAAIHGILLTGLCCFVLASWLGIAASAADPGEPVPMSAGIRKFSFPATAEITRADLYEMKVADKPRAVLVLCPGFNGDGEGLIREPAWQQFALENQLALCAISFASPEKEVQASRGYFQAPRGSGNLLLSGIRLGFGEDLPILIYGFSGGGRFTISVATWSPKRVLSWCAYSACWWDQPTASPGARQPGLVACGEDDASNYGTSTTFFAEGRALGLPWTWMSLGGTGHAWSEPLNRFVRAYFAAVLHQTDRRESQSGTTSLRSAATGNWHDVDTKEEISAAQASGQPTLASWLPDKSLNSLWSDLHCP